MGQLSDFAALLKLKSSIWRGWLLLLMGSVGSSAHALQQSHPNVSWSGFDGDEANTGIVRHLKKKACSAGFTDYFSWALYTKPTCSYSCKLMCRSWCHRANFQIKKERERVPCTFRIACVAAFREPLSFPADDCVLWAALHFFAKQISILCALWHTQGPQG